MKTHLTLKFQNLECIALLAGFWDILAKALHFFVLVILEDVLTAGVCNNPVLNIMVYPNHRWYEQIMIHMNFLEEISV